MLRMGMLRMVRALPDCISATRQLAYDSLTDARSVARSQRWAAWWSSRRCQIIESDTRGDTNGSGRMVSGLAVMKSAATRRGTTASALDPTRTDLKECSGTLVQM